MDLRSEDHLNKRLDEVLNHHNAIRKGLGKTVYKKENLKKDLLKIAPQILNYAKPTWKVIDEFHKLKKKILFEGAQGILLDVDHGTYPYVTSSNTVAASAATGSGCGLNLIGYVLGITKAYTTRVGEGPFPTELKDNIGELIGKRGHEFGTVTNRQRRCGWFDAVLVKQTCKISGITGIALTKLDVLDELEEIKMCVGYKLNGITIDYLPAAVEDQIKVKPVFSICNPGDASDITNFDQKLAPDFYQKQYEKKFEAPLNKVLEILTIDEKSNTSPIMEMIQHVSVTTFPLKETKHGNRLIIISDMIQNSPPNFSMYSSYDFNSFKNSNYYKKVNTNLRNASIYILKTRRPNFEHLQGEKLIKFWQKFFKDMDSGNFTIDPVEG